MTTYRTRPGHTVRLTPHPFGVLACVTFAPRDGQPTGGGAAIGRDEREAGRMIQDVIAAHEGGRHG